MKNQLNYVLQLFGNLFVMQIKTHEERIEDGKVVDELVVNESTTAYQKRIREELDKNGFDLRCNLMKESMERQLGDSYF